jgi:lambda repressor-like predicted transcriptional regulator
VAEGHLAEEVAHAHSPGVPTTSPLTPAIVRALLVVHDESISSLARKTGLARTTIHAFLRGRTVCPRTMADMARALGVET